MYKKLLIVFSLGGLFLGSCKKDDNDAMPMKVPYSTLTPTTSYFKTFTDNANATTVDFSGQTTRISMLKEIDAYMKTWSTGTVNAQKLKDMYTNQNSPFTSTTLNAATDKTISSKTAQSFSATEAADERNTFNAYFDSLAAASTHASSVASQGVAGLLDAKYLVNAKGFEYGQFVQKGLIGAMMLDQISNIYLGAEKQAADNSTLVANKNYTTLEHHWDEAYGYLTANAYFPMKDTVDPTKWLESYLGSYVRQVTSPYGNPEEVYMAFLKGRAGIVNKDLSTRDAQITIIRSALERSIATIAVSYLNKTITATTNGAKFHALSEGHGFIYALRYGYNAKINRAKSNELLAVLTGKPNGFWSLTQADIENVRNQIADAFGISRTAVVNH
jgi:hypothetical protein